MINWGLPSDSVVKNLPTMQEIQVRSLGQEYPLEKEMTTHSSLLAWRIPWTEEPDGLQSMSQLATLYTDWQQHCDKLHVLRSPSPFYAGWWHMKMQGFPSSKYPCKAHTPLQRGSTSDKCTWTADSGDKALKWAQETRGHWWEFQQSIPSLTVRAIHSHQE